MPRVKRTAEDHRRAELAKIHMAAKALGLDRDTYEDVLWTICRVRSAADLDSQGRFQGRFKMLAHFRSLGWNQKPKRKRTNYDPKDRKIWSLWYQLKDAGLIAEASARGLRSEVKALTDCDDLKFCTAAQKSHIIECLKKWLERARCI